MWHIPAVRIALGVVAALVFVAAMIYATLGESAVECRVCVTFGHRTECRTGYGADREGAVQGAVANACAVLASGVTQSIECTTNARYQIDCSD